MKSIAQIALLASFSLSCSSNSIIADKFSCEQLDWFEIGRSDGVRGADSMSYSDRKTNCDGFSIQEHERYVNGWYAGVDKFCAPAQGFAFGRTGRKYSNICPSAKETSFLRAYRKGMRVYLYEKDNQLITDELQKITDKADKIEGQKNSKIVKQMTELETRLELNKALIAEIQTEVKDSLSQTRTF